MTRCRASSIDPRIAVTKTFSPQSHRAHKGPSCARLGASAQGWFQGKPWPIPMDFCLLRGFVVKITRCPKQPPNHPRRFHVRGTAIRAGCRSGGTMLRLRQVHPRQKIPLRCSVQTMSGQMRLPLGMTCCHYVSAGSAGFHGGGAATVGGSVVGFRLHGGLEACHPCVMGVDSQACNPIRTPLSTAPRRSAGVAQG
jgi:hypothetical protein